MSVINRDWTLLVLSSYNPFLNTSTPIATDGQVWSAQIFIETSELFRNFIITSVVVSKPNNTSVFSESKVGVLEADNDILYQPL